MYKSHTLRDKAHIRNVDYIKTKLNVPSQAPTKKRSPPTNHPFL